MKFEQAQRQSLKKWENLRSEFASIFGRVSWKCGFCEYQISKPNYIKGKCKYCLEDFPDIVLICNDMLARFPTIETQVYDLIDEIIQTINNQKEPPQ